MDANMKIYEKAIALKTFDCFINFARLYFFYNHLFETRGIESIIKVSLFIGDLIFTSISVPKESFFRFLENPSNEQELLSDVLEVYTRIKTSGVIQPSQTCRINQIKALFGEEYELIMNHFFRSAVALNFLDKKNGKSTRIEFVGLFDKIVNSEPLKHQKKCRSCDAWDGKEKFVPEIGRNILPSLKQVDSHFLVCGLCKIEHYCTRECQRKDWRNHKQFCLEFKEDEKQSSNDLFQFSFNKYSLPELQPEPQPEPSQEHNCGNAETTFKCSGCNTKTYCCGITQKADWKEHKKICKIPQFSGGGGV